MRRDRAAGGRQRRSEPGRSAAFAWTGTLLLVTLCVLPIGVANGPPSYPPEPERPDELALVPRDWEEVRRTDGLVIDVEGTERGPSGERQTGVGYRVHGDIAAMEGTLTIAASGSTPKPVFNTGFRLHRVVFDPPLDLADGGELVGVLPGSLDWRTDRPIDTGGSPYALAYGFRAQVPRPGPDGWSPQENGTGGADDTNDTGTVGRAGVVLRWTVGFVADPQDDVMVHVVSPANAHVALRVEVDRNTVDEETWHRLNDTRAVFSFLVDYAGSQRTVTVSGPQGQQMQGVYLVQEGRAATLRVLNTSQPEVSWSPAPGRPAPGPVERVLNAPLTLNATVRVDGQSVSGYDGQTLARAAHLRIELGFVMDLPEPGDAASPTPPAVTPAAGVLLVILASVALLGRGRRSGIDKET